MDPKIAVWEATWQAVLPNATYNHDWGIERAWRENFTKWGYPIRHDGEIKVEINGVSYNARVFSKIGLVYWHPAEGAKEYGRPL